MTNAMLILAAGNGILSDITTKSNEAKTAAIAVGGLVAVIIMIVGGYKAGGAIGGIVMAGIGATIFFWFVTHVSSGTVQKKITDEVNSLSGAAVTTTVAADRNGAPPHVL